MPPPGYEPFLRAICENPADDAPRLVYADWLDENGDPDRAEFIRCDCLGDGYRRDGRSGVATRLLRKNRARWIAELPSAPGVSFDDGTVRGFFSTLRVFVPENFEGLRADLFRAAPIDALTFRFWGVEERKLVSALWQAVEIPEAVHLRRLWASQQRFGPALGRFLQQFAGLQNLRQLWIRSSGLEDDGAVRLADAPHLRSLEELDLAYNGLTDASAQALVRSPNLDRVWSLNVRGNFFTPAGVRALQERFGRRVILG